MKYHWHNKNKMHQPSKMTYNRTRPNVESASGMIHAF